MSKKINLQLIFVVGTLIVFGLLFLTTLSAPASLNELGTANYYIVHQILYGLLPGLFLCFVAYKIPLSFIRKVAPFLILANLAVMCLIFLPVIGSGFWGAKRWLNMGFFIFQPSEFLKISAILYLAALISGKLSEDQKRGWILAVKKGYDDLKQVFIPFVIFLIVLAIILILQPDVSTLGIISLTLLAMYFSVRTPFWHVPMLMTVGALGLAILIKIEPYRLQRLLIFLHPETDPLGTGYQIKQSLIALGSGGLFGKGLGMSSQKFGFLPAAMSDSVFPIIGEELGIIGCTIVIGLFLFFLWSGINVARKSNDKFAQLTALGITFWITIQAFVNISSAMGVFPLAGIPLPFFSYGGSHLAAELIGIGLLFNVSKNT